MEYLFNIQSNNIILERNIERRWPKLSPSEVSDVRFGRPKNQFIHNNITFHYQWTIIIISSIKCSISKFDRIQMWKIYYSFKSFKYLISLLRRNYQMQDYLIQSNSNVEDLFISNIISNIPFITNEEYLKLYE